MPIFPLPARQVAKTAPKRTAGVPVHSPSDCGSPGQEFSPGDPLEGLTLDLASAKNVSRFCVQPRLCFLLLRIVATQVKFKSVITEASTGRNSFNCPFKLKSFVIHLRVSSSLDWFCDFPPFQAVGSTRLIVPELSVPGSDNSPQKKSLCQKATPPPSPLLSELLKKGSILATKSRLVSEGEVARS